MHCDMSYRLNSLTGIIEGVILGITIVVSKRDTRSLDYSSHNHGELLSRGGVWGGLFTEEEIWRQ